MSDWETTIAMVYKWENPDKFWLRESQMWKLWWKIIPMSSLFHFIFYKRKVETFGF